MNILIWSLQGLLIAMFLMSGIMKSTQPIEKLKGMGLIWTERFNVSTVRFIGIAQLAGALGLLLPYFLGWSPILSVLAALGLAMIMFLAALHHFKHKEYTGILTNLCILAIAVFVAYFRFQHGY